MTTPEETTHPMIVADWSPEWEHWIVTAEREGRWTLVGLFREAAQAFRAAARARSELSLWERGPETAVK